MRGLISRETLPESQKNEKLFPNRLFGNNVICSPLAQLVSSSVALPAELVLIFSRNKDKSTSASASCCKMHLSWNTRKIAVWKICTFLKLQTSSNTDFHIFLVFLKIWAEPNSRSSRSGALNQALKKGRGYLPEIIRQIRTYLPEVLQQIRSYLPEVLRQISSYFPEVLWQIRKK